MHVGQEGDHRLIVSEVLDLEQVDIDDDIAIGEPALHQDGALFLVQCGLILDDLPGASLAILLGSEAHLVARLIVDHKILQLRHLCLGPMQLNAFFIDTCEVHVHFKIAGMIQQVCVVLTQKLIAQLMIGLEGPEHVLAYYSALVGSFEPLLLIESRDILLARQLKLALLLAALRLLIIFHLLLLLGCNFFGELHSLETGFFNLERAVRWLPLHQFQGFLLLNRRLLLLDLSGSFVRSLEHHGDFLALELNIISAAPKLVLSLNLRQQGQFLSILFPFVELLVIAVEFSEARQSLRLS